ncbi:MAG TPA: ATP synthase F1 subunit epsilon [Candidatus Fimicola cottocaccae]|nr:ATP synthase F1 subunit epsilon [Candidatus Fimicola cottocaccae]
MEKTFDLKIVASDKKFYSGPCEKLIIPAIDGSLGIMAGHESTVTTINSGELRFQVDGQWHKAAVSEGFVEIMPDYVILLVDTAELPEEIDIKRAKLAKERAEERLRQKQSMKEYYYSKAALARAMARLKVTQR